jgi:hypothetical protein
LLIARRRQKNIGIILWYNSNGDWNDAPQTPRNMLLTHEVLGMRILRLRDMGVKGFED